MWHDYTKARIVKTGYELSAQEIANLSPEEKSARNKQMLESREELKRLKDLDDELIS